MCDELKKELRKGSDLAIALVDHLAAMGGAGACVIPVIDRAAEYVVAVMPRQEWERLNAPASATGEQTQKDNHE